jgi:conjugative relaxase-like TrwC/TraI family protein
MLRFSGALSASQAEHYYQHEFSRGDYYTEGETIIASEWLGAGAAKLGLRGAVRPKDFAHLLAGRSPTGEVLVPARQGLSERRAGHDVTLSPHKTVSYMGLAAHDPDAVEAHTRAVRKTVVELERHAQAWARGGKEVVTTGTLVVALFQHETSRALDPQLHTHCVVLNLTLRGGEWRALQEQGLFQMQRLARAIYEAELMKELARLGYRVQLYRDERHGRDRAVGIAGFTSEQIKAFSKRSREIQKELEKRGLDSRLSGEKVALRTRVAKAKGIDREALLWGWRKAATELGIKYPERARVVERVPAAEHARHVAAAVDGVVEHLSERKSVFKLTDLELGALTRGLEHGVTIDDVRAEVASREELVVAGVADARNARVTTMQAVSEERELLERARAGHGRGFSLSVKLGGRGLGEDQERVARHLLETPDLLLAAVGKAGTGKTTTLGAVREAGEAGGVKLLGFAVSTSAVETMRGQGIEATTVSAALEDQALGFERAPRQLWILDEASQLGTRAALQFLEKARVAGAKVALVGDGTQHGSVVAGGPFELLVGRGAVKVEQLDEVRRQKDLPLRAAVVAASEDQSIGKSVRLLERQGRVVEVQDRRARHERIAADFLKDGGKGVVIAPSNAERVDLNRRIREGLVSLGQVEKRSFKAQVAVRRDLTAEEKRRAASFAPGDVLRFTRRTGGWAAGERARVVGVDAKRNWLEVEVLKTGQVVKQVNPNVARAFEVERLEERRFAVGDRVQFRERDRKLDVANGAVGVVERLDAATGQALVRVGTKGLRLDFKEPRALDHAYAMTSYRSQSLSKERVYLTVDTRHSEELVNRRQYYVSVSRAIWDARVYTDDKKALSRAVSRAQASESALALFEKREQPSLKGEVKTRAAGALAVYERSGHERGTVADGAGRSARGGDDRRAAGRGSEVAERGPARAAGAAVGTPGAERSRAQGADRVPGPGAAGAAQGRGAARDAALGRAGEAGRGRAAEAPGHERGAPGSRPASDLRGHAAVPPSRAVERGGALPGRGAGGAGRDLGVSAGGGGRGAERERGARRGVGAGAGQEAGAEVQAARERARLMTREEILKSRELAKAYASELEGLLRLVRDKETAREAARMNVSAVALGQERPVTREVVTRVGEERLRAVLARGGDLDELRRELTPRAERQRGASVAAEPTRNYGELER